MSSGFHANISENSRRMSMISCRIGGSMVVPIATFLEGSSSHNITVSVGSPGSTLEVFCNAALVAGPSG